MSQYIKQLDFSTTGLLTVMIIFAGLLVYANFYPFEKESELTFLETSKPASSNKELAQDATLDTGPFHSQIMQSDISAIGNVDRLYINHYGQDQYGYVQNQLYPYGMNREVNRGKAALNGKQDFDFNLTFAPRTGMDDVE